MKGLPDPLAAGSAAGLVVNRWLRLSAQMCSLGAARLGSGRGQGPEEGVQFAPGRGVLDALLVDGSRPRSVPVLRRGRGTAPCRARAGAARRGPCQDGWHG